MATIALPADNTAFRISESNLKKVMDDLFLVLSEPEKSVIIGRNGLDGVPKKTLETIGDHFEVTRERIRQIENNAIKKLRRNLLNSQIHKILEVAREILSKYGGVCSSDFLISSVLQQLHTESDYSGNVLRFALSLDEKIVFEKRPIGFLPFYRLSFVKTETITSLSKDILDLLKERKEPMSFAEVFRGLQRTGKSANEKEILGISKINTLLMVVGDMKVGLAKWRNINPKSIRDKAMLILEKEKKPLHFIDLANKISETGTKKRHVTVQAVHNDLIRFPEFMLVGRGMYALSKWGIPAGTVMDVIAHILKEEGPLSRQEIIEKVQQLRDVKENTISFNLQKYKAFVRVGRAVYDFDASEWEEPEAGRGRAFLKQK